MFRTSPLIALSTYRFSLNFIYWKHKNFNCNKIGKAISSDDFNLLIIIINDRSINRTNKQITIYK